EDSGGGGRVDVRVAGAVGVRPVGEFMGVDGAKFARGSEFLRGSKVVCGSPDPAPSAFPNGSDGTSLVFSSSPRQPLTIPGIAIRNKGATRCIAIPRLGGRHSA